MNELFKQVEQIILQAKQAQEESRKRGEQFNMFWACKVNHYETSHSAIIAELLDPQGSHGQGDFFLTLFLLSYKSDFCFSLEKGATVATEVVTKDGRIDILITNPEGQAIIIENKIYAKDQWKQLQRYDKYASENYGKRNYEILYLTLFGDEASGQSCKDVEYIPISYEIQIVEWLEECIGFSARLPLIRETLIQYQQHIKHLTNQTMEREEQEKLFEVMESHAEETGAIINAANNGYSRFIWNKYVKPAFDNYAAKNGLMYVDGDTYQYFHRPEWKKTAVAICAGGKRHYIGVSRTLEGSDDDLNKLSRTRLVCLSDAPTGGWPYGSDWLVPYECWDAGNGTIPAMIDGRFAKFVTDKVKRIIDEVEEKNLLMF